MKLANSTPMTIRRVQGFHTPNFVKICSKLWPCIRNKETNTYTHTDSVLYIRLSGQSFVAHKSTVRANFLMIGCNENDKNFAVLYHHHHFPREYELARSPSVSFSTCSEREPGRGARRSYCQTPFLSANHQCQMTKIKSTDPGLILSSSTTGRTCPCGRVVNALGRHVQYSMTRSVAGVRLGPGTSVYQRIISNNCYTHDEQGDNSRQEKEGSTVSSINCDCCRHLDLAVSSLPAVPA